MTGKVANKSKTEPLLLSDMQPFGVGGRRLCYTHPHEPGKCVKVLRHDEGRTIRGKNSGIVPARFRRAYDNNTHEQQILESLFARIGPQMSQHLPRSYGIVETDLGPGLVLDLVRDDDGNIARSIRELISTGFSLADFKPAFDEFSEFVLKHVVLTRNLHDHNLVAQHRDDGNWRLYLIDGFGDSAWLPVARWIRSVGKTKVRKRIDLAWPKMEKFAASGGVTPEMIENSSWGQGLLNHRG